MDHVKALRSAGQGDVEVAQAAVSGGDPLTGFDQHDRVELQPLCLGHLEYGDRGVEPRRAGADLVREALATAATIAA